MRTKPLTSTQNNVPRLTQPVNNIQNMTQLKYLVFEIITVCIFDIPLTSLGVHCPARLLLDGVFWQMIGISRSMQQDVAFEVLRIVKRNDGRVGPDKTVLDEKRNFTIYQDYESAHGRTT